MHGKQQMCAFKSSVVNGTCASVSTKSQKFSYVRHKFSYTTEKCNHLHTSSQTHAHTWSSHTHTVEEEKQQMSKHCSMHSLMVSISSQFQCPKVKATLNWFSLHILMRSTEKVKARMKPKIHSFHLLLLLFCFNS